MLNLIPGVLYAVIFSVLIVPLSSYAEVSTERTITFANRCPYPVWIGVTPSAVPGTGACSNDSQCNFDGNSPGSCINSQCVYPFPTPSTGTWKLEAYGPSSGAGTIATAKINLIASPKYPTQKQYVFNVAGRTNCCNDGTGKLTCETASCTTDTSGRCISGLNNPTTHAEITFNQMAVDFYDISAVNGINIPISISLASPSAAADPKPGQSAYYWCGSAGYTDAVGTYAKSQGIDNILGCNWQFTPPSTAYTDPVTNQTYNSSVFYTLVNYEQTNTACMSDSDCEATFPGSNYRCGFSANDMASNASAVPTCGLPNAYTVPANVCGGITAQGPAIAKRALGCDSDTDTAALKQQAYYMCALPPQCSSTDPKTPPPASCNTSALTSALDTCFTSGTLNPQCCGCANWTINYNGVETPIPVSDQCVAGIYSSSKTNNYWQNNVRSKVGWIKGGCPIAYSFAFDDVGSTMVCSSQTYPENDGNVLDYQVTFCPSNIFTTTSSTVNNCTN